MASCEPIINVSRYKTRRQKLTFVLSLDTPAKVRKTPSWPSRSWANSSLLDLYSRTNVWANLRLVGQPNTFLAESKALDGVPPLVEQLFAQLPKSYGPGRPGRLSALSVSLCKSVFYGAFVWARRALKSQKRRFPARADDAGSARNWASRVDLGFILLTGVSDLGFEFVAQFYAHNELEPPSDNSLAICRKTVQHVIIRLAKELESRKWGRRQVGSEVGATSAFCTRISIGMHGPTCIFWANLTPSSLQPQVCATTCRHHCLTRPPALRSAKQVHQEQRRPRCLGDSTVLKELSKQFCLKIKRKKEKYGGALEMA
jgi:hypothetical protein